MLRRVAKVPGGHPLPLLGGVGRLDVCVAVGLESMRSVTASTSSESEYESDQMYISARIPRVK